MDVVDERFAVYTAILLICSAIGALSGVLAATVTLGLVVAGVEVAYWIGGALSAPGQLSA